MTNKDKKTTAKKPIDFDVLEKLLTELYDQATAVFNEAQEILVPAPELNKENIIPITPCSSSNSISSMLQSSEYIIDKDLLEVSGDCHVNLNYEDTSN